MPENHRPSPSAGPAVVGRVITALLIVSPVVAVAVSVPLLWGHAIHLRDVVLAAILYAVTGHGVTVGYHRLFTHRGFTPRRPLKIALAVAGSMAVEGSVVSWVANHRRHHVYSDRPGDPHSPHTSRLGVLGPVRGFLHAHVGWMFTSDPAAPERYAADVVRDRDLSTVSTLFPLWAVASLALPFGAGWLWSGSLVGGLTAFVWAGIIRMALLHHVTWSVNSICHMVGARPFLTDDRSRNVRALALVSFGESWHNLHHAYPASARHGVGRGQIDTSAGMIRLFEKIGWATNVHWPSAERLAAAVAPPVLVPAGR
ncbi:MAG TPA: acyl-CoA desaturase [Acidimicrobiales bacterium]|nr:acyl-CoA desaturase [Acidimicrobiales bacterium]